MSLPSTRCPRCGKAAVSAMRLLTMGPLRKVRCASCGALVRPSPLVGTATVLLVTMLFPLGAVFGIAWLQPFSGPGIATLAFLGSGLIACLPAALLMLLCNRLRDATAHP